MYFRRIGCRIRGTTATSEQKRVARHARTERLTITDTRTREACIIHKCTPGLFFFFKKECFHLKKRKNKTTKIIIIYKNTP